MLTAKEAKLLEALEPVAQENGYEIVTVEVSPRKPPTIRVYIDTEGGVSFDELSAAQEWINAIMDDIDPFPGAYQLEVSSPGIDRPLRTPEHFERFAGETVQVSTDKPIDGRGKWTGTLLGCEDGLVKLDVDGQAVSLELATIKRAHVKGAVDFS